ncbi:MAG: superoxide dismutase [Phycisphaerae bacterium]|jgi:Fe-Mn family superoxide dismutase|nr:superoxide dismutase [Phycisphaerae bacterium]MBT7658166.1 superoxide dismutase [Phycisphaerae bacterium]|tara:strand:- start:15604 stop:16239 length:636 start_codon:yes stop_codon:yes gene_type:complete
MTYELPELGYAFNALEPNIDARTMEIHHDKHHAGYVAKLNAAVEGTDLGSKTVCELISSLDSLPENIRGAVRNNGGGHCNHSLFWKVISPGGANAPEGELATAIDASFGSFDAFKEQFAAAAATRFGSGWAWLVADKDGNLSICSTANQDNPRMTNGGTPILGLDVWEHAYYLHYQNRRPDYIQAFWNVVNWTYVASVLEGTNLTCSCPTD